MIIESLFWRLFSQAPKCNFATSRSITTSGHWTAYYIFNQFSAVCRWKFRFTLRLDPTPEETDGWSLPKQSAHKHTNSLLESIFHLLIVWLLSHNPNVFQEDISEDYFTRVSQKIGWFLYKMCENSGEPIPHSSAAVQLRNRTAATQFRVRENKRCDKLDISKKIQENSDQRLGALISRE